MFDQLKKINVRPKPFEFCTVSMLWNDPYISQKMLEVHLNKDSDLASRNKGFLDKSSRWILEHFDVSPGKKICDFGCGPGLYTTPFAKKGAVVTGIDFSERSIHYASKVAAEKNLKINYELQNYLEYTTDNSFDLITMIYFDFCALSTNQRKTLLSKFHELLEDDGALILDVYSLNQYALIEEKSVYTHSSNDFIPNFWSDKPYYVFTNTFKYDAQHLYLDKYTVIEKDKTREIYNWIQCNSLESWIREFQDSGFEIVEHYSDISGEQYDSKSPSLCLVARKKK